MEDVPALVEAAQDEGLEFLLIGGNALRLHGYLRNTIDVDFLVPENGFDDWRSFLEKRSYRMFHATDAFAQFEAPEPWTGTPVDLMRVTRETWEKLRSGSQEKRLGNLTVSLPCPEHLVALKLHSASSPQRSKPGQDWEDIRQLVRIHRLDPEAPLFHDLILKYGGEAALQRIKAFPDENDS